jgi:hypothetical protein
MDKELISAALIKYLATNNLIGIKGGTNRATFLDIWMVSVGERIFARSWGMSNRSWFTEFVDQGVGQLKFGDQVIDVKGLPLRDEEMNGLVSQAYKAKYTQEENKPYVNEITELKYNHFTMEFFTL